MTTSNHKTNWENYRDLELRGALPIIKDLGFKLDEKQVHIGGERFLSSGQKLVLIGRQISTSNKVVIKISSHPDQINEIKNERNHRHALKKIKFSYNKFFSPKEVVFKKVGKYYISIVEFIEQEKTFLERSQEEQFFLSLKAFETQEGVHATTYEHVSIVNKTFESLKATDYTELFNEYKNKISSLFSSDDELKKILISAKETLEKNSKTIDLYSDFLTHWDFVPHNVRINDGNIYLLDHSSIRFGNKHESWARFINFMVLYNRTLEKNLLKYLKNNRSEEELLSLKLMRIFRLGEILYFYGNSLKKAEGDLLTLNKKRFKFWTHVLKSIVNDQPISDEIVNTYKKERDSLRGQEEIKRQEGLH